MTQTPHHSVPPNEHSEAQSAQECELSKRIREALGATTYANVARRTAHNPETVRRYLNGGTPSVAFVEAVAREFGVSLEWLFLGTGPVMREELPAHYLGMASTEALRTVLEIRHDGSDHGQGNGSGISVRLGNGSALTA